MVFIGVAILCLLALAIVIALGKTQPPSAG